MHLIYLFYFKKIKLECLLDTLSLIFYIDVVISFIPLLPWALNSIESSDILCKGNQLVAYEVIFLYISNIATGQVRHYKLSLIAIFFIDFL